MKTASSGIRLKKLWSAPEIEFLGGDYINGGGNQAFQEGVRTNIPKNYYSAIRNKDGVRLTEVPKAVWKSFQS